MRRIRWRAHRRDVCEFANDRVPFERRAAFVHRLLERETAEVRMFLPRLERFMATIPEGDQASPELSNIAGDSKARTRYLDLARDADSPAIRARMIALAGRLGWLDPTEERDELVLMFNERLARNAVTPAEVDLACTLNKDGELDSERDRLQVPPAQATGVAQASLLTCFGSGDARERVVRALTSGSESDVRFAQVVLRHRPLDDAGELRAVTGEIVRMGGGEAQMRALHALSSHRLSDPVSLEELVRPIPGRGFRRRADGHRERPPAVRVPHDRVAGGREHPAHAAPSRRPGRGRDRRPDPPDAGQPVGQSGTSLRAPAAVGRRCTTVQIR